MTEVTSSKVIAIIAAFGTIATGWFTYNSANYVADVSAQGQSIVKRMEFESAERSAYLTKQKDDRVADIEMVKLALNILSGSKSPETVASRTFAVDLLRKYSGVVIEKETASTWVNNGTVEFGAKNTALATAATYELFNPPSLDELLRRNGLSREDLQTFPKLDTQIPK